MSFDVCIRLMLFQFLITIESSLPLPLQAVHKGIFINELILYSEPAMYTPLELTGLLRKRRGADSVPFTKPLRISFKAHHKIFNLLLSPEQNIFADNAVFHSSSGKIYFDVNRVFRGVVDGEENSSVQGIITREGLFDGTIISHGETYYVEPISRYNATVPQSRVHTVIYKTSDVRPPSALTQTCASHNLHLRTKRSYRKSPKSLPSFESDVLKTSRVHSNLVHHKKPIVNGNTVYKMPNISVLQHQNLINRPRVLTAKESSKSDRCEYGEVLFNNSGLQRHVNKRATVDPKKTTCMLYLQADHLFFQKYGTEEACIEVMTRHVQRVNAIYRATDFNQDGKNDNISFMIKRIKVHTVEATNEPGYRFPGNYGVEKFLELFSEEDYDAFCLAYMFTYRDFEMGTLGLAWTGDLKNAGGVCEKNGHYRGSLKSLNTGIVTLLNYGKHVPPAVSHVTLAHEIGHNFGSPHDPEMCTPGGEDGNYIMFARATSGDKKNNNKFSPCSLNSINPVLNSKARNPMGCFTEPQLSICGNGVVESGEECDCGWEEDCRDSCCFPQRRYPPAGEPPCRLTPRSICSPSQGPCCSTDCQLRFGDKCRDDNGCRDASFCDGRSPQCPASKNKPNKTVCNDEFVCFMGECTGSICLAYGLESCQCMPRPEDPPTKACELCCKKPGDDQLCLSSFEWNEAPYDIPDMFSKPGTPCSDYNGYCDVFQKCREVDPSGPLATLRKLLLSEESFASFKKWVAGHWYAVLIVATVIVLILIVSLKAFGKQQDLKMKTLTIMHSATTETVRLPTEGEGAVTIHPPAVRSKLPLHRKVREKKLHTRVANKRKKKSSPTKAAESQNRQDKKSPDRRDKVSKLKGLEKAAAKATCPIEPSVATTTPSNIPIYENVVVAKPEDQPKLSTGKIISSRLKRSNRVSTEVTSEGAKKLKEDLKKELPKSSLIVGKKSPVKRKKRKKEVIKYDNNNATSSGALPCEEDPLGKVQSWLMQSILPSTGKTGENFGIMTLTLPKSKSSPVGLSGTSAEPVKTPPKIIHKDKVVHIPKSTYARSKSSGNLQKDNRKGDDKVKLQVMYRPPFKFSVKIRNDTVLGNKSLNSQSKSKLKLPTTSAKPTSRRDAVLVQMPIDDIDSNIHTVPSDLDVLLSESEFLFSDA